jgi:two-component system, chemotaxis family, sensor kinase CheA
MDDIVRDFLIESKDNLDRLDQELVKLETDPTSIELLKSIFRTIHTIKGSCGFLGFSHLEKVAHAGENLLSKLRDKELQLNAEITNGLLAMVDAVRRMLGEIEVTEHDGDNEYPELIERLKGLQQAGKPQSETAVQMPAPPSSASALRTESGKVENREESREAAQQSKPLSVESTTKPAAATNASTPAKKSHSEQFRPSPGKIGGLLVERGAIRAEDLAVALQEQESGDRRRLGEILVALGLCRQDEVNVAQQILESRSRETMVDTVRVTVDVLDTLMNLVGELVLARNQLLQFANTVPDAGFHAVSQRMNLIASELQTQVMKTRMQPIGNVWNKFPRTVRDLALNCGKEVHLEMEGQSTELDRTIIEAIKDPLTHLVRNALDHGIETPDTRKQLGKDPSGRLKLRAFHEGGQVNIEISDDGAGLNVELIRKKALERGVITSQQAARMPDRDIFNLIFLPGFSTAQKVTKVSGRGVGMDVVKTNIEKIGGVVELQSLPGQGTTVHVKIPLTLAIVPALIVRCNGERFAIPQVSLTELVRCEAGKGIESVHGSPVYRLRGQILPLIYLEHVLRANALNNACLQTDAVEQTSTGDQRNVNIAVLQADGQQFGLVVDDILDTQEIVVKPLAKQLKGISAYAGATIMGDGRVALILDVTGLAEQAKLMSKARESVAQENAQELKAEDQAKNERALLIAQNGAFGRVAIPLSQVSRLEEFSATAVERAGRQEVMQYRGHIIPVVKVWDVLADGMDAYPESRNKIQVVIYSDQGHTIGLIVDRIIDIVHEYGALEALAPRPGVAGTFVAQKQVTELLDVPAIVKAAVPGVIENSEAGAAPQEIRS